MLSSCALEPHMAIVLPTFIALLPLRQTIDWPRSPPSGSSASRTQPRSSKTYSHNALGGKVADVSFISRGAMGSCECPELKACAHRISGLSSSVGMYTYLTA